MKLFHKKKKNVWFIKVRNSYLQCSPQGWALYLPYTAWIVLVAAVFLRDSESLGRDVLSMTACWVAGVVLFHWYAAQKS